MGICQPFTFIGNAYIQPWNPRESLAEMTIADGQQSRPPIVHPPQTRLPLVDNNLHLQPRTPQRRHQTQTEDQISSEAWLKAAELTPTWVWALVGLQETMQVAYKEHPRFAQMIQQVQEFLHNIIKVHKCDPDTAKNLAFRLGMRHRKYMNEGNDNSYWTPFAQQLPLAITKGYFHVVNNNSRLRRMFRIRSHTEKTEEEELIDSWRQFMNVIVEAMKRGYEGCPTEKTPLRLSITNSIISMASVRSTRSRSASHFLEPTLSPALACTVAPTTASSSPPSHHERSRSIFRNRRASKNLTSLRRLSSPNNPGSLLTASDLQLLSLSGQRNDQRRSLSVLNK